MTKETTYTGMMGEWQKLLDAMEAQASELQYLDPQRRRLEAVVREGLALSQEQSAHNAERQVRSQRLQVLIGDGRRIATNLRSNLRTHYGFESGMLAHFNLRPFRGRQTSAALRRKAADRSSPPPQEEEAAPES